MHFLHVIRWSTYFILLPIIKMETKKFIGWTTTTWQLANHRAWMMDQNDWELRTSFSDDLELRIEIERCQTETRLVECMGCPYYHRRCGGGRKR